MQTVEDPYQLGYKLRLAMETSYVSDTYPYASGSPESIEFWRGWRDANSYCECKELYSE